MQLFCHQAGSICTRHCYFSTKDGHGGRNAHNDQSGQGSLFHSRRTFRVVVELDGSAESHDIDTLGLIVKAFEFGVDNSIHTSSPMSGLLPLHWVALTL
jgi:hypothetical protein